PKPRESGIAAAQPDTRMTSICGCWPAMAPKAIVIAGGACEGAAQLLSRLETALRAAARLLHDPFGSIVQRSLETLSMLEPAAPSEGMPAAAIVAPTSLASRPVSVRLRAPKLSSQLRDVISTLLTRQTTESASTGIFVLGVKPKLVLPRKSRAMTRLSNA